MLRQILGRLPRTKTGKTENNEEPASGQPSASAGGLINSIKVLSSHGVSSVQASLFGKTGPEPSTSSLVAPAAITDDSRTTAFSASDSPFSFPNEPLPLFREVPSSEKQNLLIKKLKLCSIVFDFNDANKNVREKEIKRQTLQQLVDFVSSANAPFSEIVMEEATKMVAVNIFRSLPPALHENPKVESGDFEEEEAAIEPAWCHLHLVYEFFVRFVMSSGTDPKVAKHFINHSFVSKLLDLFDSEDSRERDYLKTILHRIYGKFMVHRPFIRKAINNIFYHFIFETEIHNGISELLEILGSVVNGFALPLKEEHKLFLVHALIPLHKPACVSIYHRQLSYCITLFVEKDSKLADTVIRGLLKYWPVTNSHKEVLFLGELEEVLEATQPAELQCCMVPLFRQIGRCLNSLHFQVAERALFLWNNDHIINIAVQNRSVVLPVIYSALEKNTRGHWNQVVHSLTLNARKMFSEMDQELFQECKRKFEEEEVAAKIAQERRELTWQRLESIAAESMPNQVVMVHN